MGQLAISDKMLCKVTEFAKAHGVPVERQVEEMLHEAILGYNNAPNLRGIAEKIAAMTPKDVKQTDSTLLIREDRDR